MTFTYDVADLTSDLAKVRLYIGDTDSTDPQLQDEEIDFLLTDEDDPVRVAAEAAETIAARYGRRVDYTLGKDVAEKASQLQKNYLELAKRLRQKAARTTAVIPFFGGQSISEKQSELEEDDLVQPFFRRDQMTEPSTEPDVSEDIYGPPMPVY